MSEILRILHLTDFHYSSDPQYGHKQEKYVSALLDEIKKNGGIDMFIFSGDLVWSASNSKDLLAAKKMLVDRVMSGFKIPNDHFLICQGNHDVDWERSYEPLNTHIESRIDSLATLNAFAKDLNSEEFKDSCRHLEPYVSFVENSIKPAYFRDGDELNNMYSIHRREVGGYQMGFITINSAWRSIKWPGKSGENGNLLYPTTLLEQALMKIKDCRFKVLAMHHPLKSFRGFNEWALEDLIYDNFDMVLSGHEHKPRSAMHNTTNGGLVHFAGGATVAGQDSIISGTLINWNLEKSMVRSQTIIYDQNRLHTYLEGEVKSQFPVNDIKKKANRLRQTIRKRWNEEVSNANNLFVSSFDAEKGRDFLSLFSEPVLDVRNPSALGDSEQKNTRVSLDSILNSIENYVILGKDKSGKTSLLKKLQIEILGGFRETGATAFFFDASEYAKAKGDNLFRRIKDYFSSNEKDTKVLLNSGKFNLLIDNHSKEFKGVVDQIRHLVQEHPRIRLILCSSYSTSKILESYEIEHVKAAKLYLCDISKQHIRQLTNKWPNINSDKKDEIVDKIYQITKRLSIPFNYWSVSLLLWVFERSSDSNYHNNMDIVNLYVDSLLEKEQLALNKTTPFSFEKYKEYLANLAHFLLESHSQSQYRASMGEIVAFTEAYLRRNKRNVIGPNEIWEYVTQKGILVEKGVNSFTFRLRGVFEYFIGFYMSLNKEFLYQGVLNDKSLFLSYKNEIEFYAGLQPKDDKLIKALHLRLKEHFSLALDKYNPSDLGIDQMLHSKVTEVFDMTEHVKTLIGDKPMSPQERDNLEAESMTSFDSGDMDIEVKIKEVFEISDDIQPDILEKILFLVSRVFRNLDGIEDPDLPVQVLSDIIDCACAWGFSLIDEAIDPSSFAHEEVEKYGSKILAILANYIPVIVQVYLSDAVGHITLENVVLELIDLYRKDKDHNQYRLFLLYFILIDLDPSRYKAMLDELMGTIKSKVIQSALLLKLHFYLAFKCHERPELEEAMKKAITEQTHKTYPQRTSQEIDLEVTKRVKIARIRGKAENKGRS